MITKKRRDKKVTEDWKRFFFEFLLCLRWKKKHLPDPELRNPVILLSNEKPNAWTNVCKLSSLIRAGNSF